MKVAILTTFMEFNPGYSLTGIVKDQITMLLKYNHEVHLYVNEQYHGNENFSNSPNFQLHKKIPFAHLVDYRSKDNLSLEHEKIVNQMLELILTEF